MTLEEVNHVAQCPTGQSLAAVASMYLLENFGVAQRSSFQSMQDGHQPLPTDELAKDIVRIVNPH